MKILIINTSGNVGKSFLARELFYFNMKRECEKVSLLEIESFNSSSSGFNGVEVEKINGYEIEIFYPELLMNENLIVDVGISNVVPFLNVLNSIDSKSIMEEFDMVIVPFIPYYKVAEDTVNTIKALNTLGIKNNKIKIILNRVGSKNQFQEFKKFIEQKTDIKLDYNLTVPDFYFLNNLFSIKREEPLYLIAKEDKDYKILAKKAYKNGKIDLGNKYANMCLMQDYAKRINKGMQDLFNYLKEQINAV